MYLKPDHRVAILLHQGLRGVQGKTGLAVLRYSDAEIVAVIDQESAGDSLAQLTGISRDVPIVASVAASLAYQPDVLIIGIAPSGGALPEAWWQEIKQAVAAGVCIVNGLHTAMATHPDLTVLLREGQWIWDVRREPTGLKVGSGQARLLSCLRVLTVGTDMSIGKMSTSLEMHRVARQLGLRSQFVATGQTGLMLGNPGIPLDAVRVDFASGAVEQAVLSLGQNQDILHVEGQGSLLNPASTATLPLLRGTQPTHLILVHRIGQTHIRNFAHVPIPPLTEVIQMYEMVARAAGAFAEVPVAAIALNTAHLDEVAAQTAIATTQAETGLPCTDPVRYGAATLLDAVLYQK
ncbi:MAG: DUF1611 domain-containing protein [Leptolyngbyaceae bacterium]|nr:DUF1611 domain-containing protein [Leptolyngbyaceae bacterium]